MSTMDETEVDPSVCYRHPNRQSWVLCQRCGRTICPECQILAPVGVQCPECVREAGGSVTWSPTGGARKSTRDVGRGASSPAWMRTVRSWLRPDGTAPVISWGLAGASLLLWLTGFFTANMPLILLAADPTRPFELWRFVTGAVAFPAGLDFSVILSFALSMLFWLINAPGAERSMGRRRFVAVVLAGVVVGNAAQTLLGFAGYGLYGALFAIFTAYLIDVWNHPPARMQVLIMLGINLVLALLIGRSILPQIIGGGLAGAGAYWLITHDGGRNRSSERTPYLLIAAGCVGAVVLAVLGGLARGF